MSSDSCAFSPLVKDRKGNQEASKLYKEIHTYVKERSVTNFLYAFSQLDKIKEKFSSSDFNSQSELKFDVFRDRYHLDALMNQQDEINKAKRELGAVSKGKPVYHETPESLVGKVMRFNDSHQTIKASIEYSSHGYYIDVDVINSQNYNTNRLLQIQQNLIGMIRGKLDDAGLNIDILDDNKGIFNIINTFYILDKFQELGEDTDNIGKSWAKLLLDLFKDNAFVKRLVNQFAEGDISDPDVYKEALETAAQAVSEYSSTYDSKKKIELTPGQERLIDAFFTVMQDTFSDIFDEDAISDMNSKAREGVSDNTFEGIDSLDIRKILGELDREFHINLDTVDALTMNITKVSELAQKFLQIKIKRMQIFENRVGVTNANTAKKRRRYQKLQKQINNGEYYVSILKLLEELVNEMAEINKNAAKEQKRIGDYAGDKFKINRVSKLVLEQLDAVKAFKKTLERIKNLEGLENDSFDADDDIAENIKELADQALDTLIKMENNARGKQYDCVQAFLRIYWGDDSKEAQKKRGSNMTLDDIMKAGVADIGFFDRMLYAATQTEDVMMNLIAEAVRREKNIRNSVMLEYKNEIQSLTSKLYKSGSDTLFMFARDSDGFPVKIVSPFDYQKYERDLEEYMEKIKKDPSIKKSDWDRLRQDWEHDHSEDYEYSFEEAGETVILKLRVPKKSLYANRNFQVGWSDVQKEYYKYMMDAKASLLAQIGSIDPNTLYDIVEISSDMIDAMHQAGGDPMKVYNAFKNKFIDMFKVREDDDEYGKLYEANGVQVTHVDVDGTPLNRLPIFYTHKMKDRSRVSMDFSRSMIAYLSASLQYMYMNNIIDALMLSKDYMMNRGVTQHSGNGMMADIYKMGKTMYVNVAQKAGMDTSLGGLADDFFEREVFGKRKKNEVLWGMNLGKLSDFLTGYSSVTGLALNTMGATANVLVGKIQMLIESGLGMGGEFFNLKELAHADVKYWALLPSYLGEISSIQKSSLMSMLIDRFDALDDFYEKLREQGFYKGPLEKIVGNKELFFLYGSGEHLLHTQGMIAVLLHIKCKHNGHEVPLFEAFDVEKDENGQGSLIIKEGYTLNDGTEITDEYLDLIKDRIKYVNTTMHGAFNSEDRGMIHRYAFGRLVMNFRQWMPAHYARRFKGRYYDPLLRQFREGYYVTSFHFLTNLVKDLRRGTLNWGRLWNELDEGQQYNLKRAAAETFLLIAVNAMLLAIGPAKDHKHNWALRHMIYQLLRVNMEIQASTPVALYGFIKNILKILNSPTAVLNVVGKWSDLLRFTDIARTIESGKHAGENKYFVNSEKAVPFIQHVDNLINIDDHEELFNYVAR